MPEFAVPRIVLYFDVASVRDMMHILQEEFELIPKSSMDTKCQKQKIAILKQVYDVCQILARFAHKHRQVKIAEQYDNVVTAITSLVTRDSSLRSILDSTESTALSIRLNQIITEFELQEKKY